MLVLEQLNSAVPLESRPSSVCLPLQQASRCHGPYSPHSHTCTFTTLMHNISSWIPLSVQSDLLSRPTPSCDWIWDFLTDRPQVVRVGEKVSAQLRSVGGPTGLLPRSFTLFTLHVELYFCTSDQDDNIGMYTVDTVVSA